MLYLYCMRCSVVGEQGQTYLHKGVGERPSAGLLPKHSWTISNVSHIRVRWTRKCGKIVLRHSPGGIGFPLSLLGCSYLYLTLAGGNVASGAHSSTFGGSSLRYNPTGKVYNLKSGLFWTLGFPTPRWSHCCTSPPFLSAITASPYCLTYLIRPDG